MKTNMHTDVTNTTRTLSETHKTASGTCTVERSTRSIKSVENTFILKDSA